MATDELLVAALVASAVALPPVSSPTPILSAWGTNPDPRGLTLFSRDTPRQTALNWRALFFQGSTGRVPLLARVPRHSSTTFICASRLSALVELAPRLAELDAGTLSGQKNCFAIIGSRQTGKTAFMRSVVHAVASAASRRTVAICVNFSDTGVREPLHLLQHALRNCPDITLPPVLAEPTASFVELLDFMISRDLRALVCIDDIEALYRCPRDSLLAERVFMQLRVLGSHNGPQRPAIVVLTGSAAVLRVLLFALDTPDYDRILRRYPCHLRFGSLNDNKFVPLLLVPIVSTVDLANAALCILDSFPRDRQRLVGDRFLFAPTAEVTPTAHSASASVPSPEAYYCIASGYTLTPAFLEWLSLRCRGLAGWIVDAARGQITRLHHLNRLLGTGGDTAARKVSLNRLLSAWIAAVKSSGRDVATAAANTSDETICVFGMPIDDAEPAGSWYDLADAGVLRFDGDCRPRMVHVLHPSDAGTLLMALHGSDTSAQTGDGMTPAEMLSLLAPQLASADEVNERLVLEGLSFTSHQPSGLEVRGRGCSGTFRGIAHSSEHLAILGTDADQLPTIDSLLPSSRRNTLYKEFPDEQGSDGIALVDGDADAGDSMQSCCSETTASVLPPSTSLTMPTTAVNTLWRVQVKMSSQLGATDVTGPMVQGWMQKMTASSSELLHLLSAKLPQGAVAVHVLWCAQRLTGPARRFLSELPMQKASEPPSADASLPPCAGQQRRYHEAEVGTSSSPLPPRRVSGALTGALTGASHGGAAGAIPAGAVSDASPEKDNFAPPSFFLLVDPSNMLRFWSPRVRRFVCERRLQQYGASADDREAAPAGGLLPQAVVIVKEVV